MATGYVEYVAPDSLRSIAEVMRGAFSTAALRRLQLAFAAVSLGRWSGMVAVSVYAFQEGGAAAVGLVTLAKMLPAALLTPISGLLADRFPRRDVLLASSLLRLLCGALVAAAVLAGLPLWAVAALVVAKTVVATPYRPAQAALLPQLASTPRQMAAANAVWNGLESWAFIVGALAGGWAIGALDPGVAFAILALPYAVAVLFIAGIPRDAVPAHREAPDGARRRDEALLGYRMVLAQPRLRRLVGLMTASKVVEGAVDTLLVVVALDLLGLSEVSVGWLNAAWGVGGVLGMVFALGLLHRGNLSLGLTLGCLLIGVPLMAIAGLVTPAAAAGGMVVLGVGYALVEIAGETLMQRLASDEVLARVFSALEGTYTASTGIGAALAPLLTATIGIEETLMVVGAALPLLALLTWRDLARYETGTEIPERPFQLLRGVPLFAPLPIASVENLALRLNPVNVAAGEEIVRQGEDGRRFYVIDAGTVEVLVDGMPIRREGPGEFFGEIALIRSTPRTATVRARGPVRLLALDGPDFVASVTGNARCLQETQAVVDGRLGTRAATP